MEDESHAAAAELTADEQRAQGTESETQMSGPCVYKDRCRVPGKTLYVCVKCKCRFHHLCASMVGKSEDMSICHHACFNMCCPVRSVVLPYPGAVLSPKELAKQAKRTREREFLGPEAMGSETSNTNAKGTAHAKADEEDRDVDDDTGSNMAVDEPEKSQDQATQDTTVPAEASTKPGVDKRNPPESNDKPAERKEKPAVRKDKPTEDKRNPPESNDKPVERKDKPIEDKRKNEASRTKAGKKGTRSKSQQQEHETIDLVDSGSSEEDGSTKLQRLATQKSDPEIRQAFENANKKSSAMAQDFSVVTTSSSSSKRKAAQQTSPQQSVGSQDQDDDQDDDREGSNHSHADKSTTSSSRAKQGPTSSAKQPEPVAEDYVPPRLPGDRPTIDPKNPNHREMVFPLVKHEPVVFLHPSTNEVLTGEVMTRAEKPGDCVNIMYVKNRKAEVVKGVELTQMRVVRTTDYLIYRGSRIFVFGPPPQNGQLSWGTAWLDVVAERKCMMAEDTGESAIELFELKVLDLLLVRYPNANECQVLILGFLQGTDESDWKAIGLLDCENDDVVEDEETALQHICFIAMSELRKDYINTCVTVVDLEIDLSCTNEVHVVAFNKCMGYIDKFARNLPRWLPAKTWRQKISIMNKKTTKPAPSRVVPDPKPCSRCQTTDKQVKRLNVSPHSLSSSRDVLRNILYLVLKSLALYCAGRPHQDQGRAGEGEGGGLQVQVRPPSVNQGIQGEGEGHGEDDGKESEPGV